MIKTLIASGLFLLGTMGSNKEDVTRSLSKDLRHNVREAGHLTINHTNTMEIYVDHYVDSASATKLATYMPPEVRFDKSKYTDIRFYYQDLDDDSLITKHDALIQAYIQPQGNQGYIFFPSKDQSYIASANAITGAEKYTFNNSKSMNTDLEGKFLSLLGDITGGNKIAGMKFQQPIHKKKL